jgi:hypothetical protein
VAGGRPTKYCPEVLQDAQEYLESGYLEDGKVIPSLVGLALYLGVSPQTLDNWAEIPEHSEFLGILTDIKCKQHELLINSGLTGAFNSAIAKLVLGKHGYSEKSETTHQGGDKPITFQAWEITGVGAED